MDRAVDIYLKAIEADPSNADIMTGLAELYILSEQYDEALSIYDNALVAIENGVEEGWIPPEDADEMRAGVLLTRVSPLSRWRDTKRASTNSRNAGQQWATHTRSWP